jgi:hypothetical protein
MCVSVCLCGGEACVDGRWAVPLATGRWTCAWVARMGPANPPSSPSANLGPPRLSLGQPPCMPAQLTLRRARDLKLGAELDDAVLLLYVLLPRLVHSHGAHLFPGHGCGELAAGLLRVAIGKVLLHATIAQCPWDPRGALHTLRPPHLAAGASLEGAARSCWKSLERVQQLRTELLCLLRPLLQFSW